MDGRTTSITALLRDRRFLLLNLEADRPPGSALETGRLPITHVQARAGRAPASLLGVKRLLVRPDAYVAWADDGTSPQQLGGWLRELT